MTIIDKAARAFDGFLGARKHHEVLRSAPPILDVPFHLQNERDAQKFSKRVILLRPMLPASRPQTVGLPGTGLFWTRHYPQREAAKRHTSHSGGHWLEWVTTVAIGATAINFAAWLLQHG